MSALQNLWRPLLIAAIFGLSVAGVTIYLVPGGTATFAYQQQATRRQIAQTMRGIDEYKKQKGSFPATLDDINPEGEARFFVHDMWRRPLRYSLSNGKPFLESLGRDGVPGGVGLDADISNQLPDPPEAQMPLLQKLEHPLARPMILAALLCGVLSGVIVFSGLKDDSVRPKSWLSLGISLLAAFMMAAFGAVIITSFHIPSGH